MAGTPLPLDSQVKDEWIPLPRVYAAMGMPGFKDTTSENVHILNGGRDDDLNDGDPHTMTFSNAEVLNSDPETYEQWRLAAEREVQESFYKMNAVSVATEEELKSIGGYAYTLPMKAVWNRKADGRFKNRGAVCSNLAPRDPCEAVWTAQAEPSSVLSALRLSQLRKWKVTQVDIKGAFMYANLPEGSSSLSDRPQCG